LSTITNWASELKAWAPTIDVVLFKGNAELRKDLYKKKIATGHFNVRTKSMLVAIDQGR